MTQIDLTHSAANPTGITELDRVLGGGVVPGSVIRCRPVGVLRMQDEAGSDEKLIAVPIDKVFDGYSKIQDVTQVSQHWLDRIDHFFEHYKDLEDGKWVRIEGWLDADDAKKEIMNSIDRYNNAKDKPCF